MIPHLNHHHSFYFDLNYYHYYYYFTAVNSTVIASLITIAVVIITPSFVEQGAIIAITKQLRFLMIELVTISFKLKLQVKLVTKPLRPQYLSQTNS